MTNKTVPADKVEKIAAAMRDAIRREGLTYGDTEFLHDMSSYIRELEALVSAPPTTWTLYWLTGDRQVIEGPDISTAMSCAGIGAGALSALDFYAEGDKDHGYRWPADDSCWVRKEEIDNPEHTQKEKNND